MQNENVTQPDELRATGPYDQLRALRFDMKSQLLQRAWLLRVTELRQLFSRVQGPPHPQQAFRYAASNMRVL